MSEDLLKRQLLLMRYDMGLTLSENLETISDVIEEQGVIKDIVRGGGVAARELEGVLKTMMKDSKVANELKNVTFSDAKGMKTGVRTAEELASAIKLGKLNGFLKGELELAILKSRTTNKALIDAAASNLARNKSFINKYSSSLAKGQAEYEKALKAAGYSEGAITSIVKQTENIGGKIKSGEDILKPSGKGTKESAAVAKDIEVAKNIKTESELSKLPSLKGKWEGLKNLAKLKGVKVLEYARSLGWKKIIMYGAAGWLAYYLWRNWNSSKPKLWSQCLIDFVGYNNFKNAVQIKPGILSVKGKTGLQPLDMNGYTYFRNDGTAKNGQFEGTWECNGGKLVLEFDGQQFYPIKSKVTPTPIVTDDGGGGGGDDSTSQPTYRACSGTYNRGCESEVIRKAQGCLGVKADGLFGSKTEAAVQAKLGKLIFTDADVDKICEKVSVGSGGVSPDEEIVTPDEVNKDKGIDLNTLNPTLFPQVGKFLLWKRTGDISISKEQQDIIKRELESAGYTMTEPDVTSYLYKTKKDITKILGGKYAPYYKEGTAFVWETPKAEESTKTYEKTSEEIRKKMKEGIVDRSTCRQAINNLYNSYKYPGRTYFQNDKEILETKIVAKKCATQGKQFLGNLEDKLNFLRGLKHEFGLVESVDNLNNVITETLKESIKNKKVLVKETSQVTKRLSRVISEDNENVINDIFHQVKILKGSGFKDETINEGLGDMLSSVLGKTGTGVVDYLKFKAAGWLLETLNVDPKSWAGEVIAQTFATLDLKDYGRFFTDCKFTSELLAESIAKAAGDKFMKARGLDSALYEILLQSSAEAFFNSATVDSIEKRLYSFLCPKLISVKDKATKLTAGK